MPDLTLFFQAMLSLFALLVIVYDVISYKIPNWISLVLLMLYPVSLWNSGFPDEWWKDIAIAAAVFVAGFIMFALRWMGGGDVKYLSVSTLWIGYDDFVPFITYVALLGGVLSVALLVGRKLLWLIGIKKDKLHRLFQEGEPVPYGLAIAAGVMLVVWDADVLI